ncbi:hypothetical protein [Virgibacillus sediminis]|uniref:Uncharacterized protein n=1 Tax=Virgibacillus sediminis TaxID=202260 RepID=A0ABV7A2B0_9BACI
MNYTSEMEKGMEQSNRICFAEYERKLDKRLEVERRREKEYQKSKQITAEFAHNL